MKIINIFVTIIFGFWICVPFAGAAEADYSMNISSPNPSNAISMDFQDVNLKTVLKVFSQQSGLNFIASQNVQDRTVTIYFDNVKVEDALNYIMNANNLTYDQEPGTNIFIVKESGKPKVETITKIYELKYAQLNTLAAQGAEGEEQTNVSGSGDIVTIIQNILTENGKVVADKRSNSLIIKDVPSQFVIIEDLLGKLDIRTPQVMISAEVLETTTKMVESLGMNWQDGTFGVYTGPVHNTVWPLSSRHTTAGKGFSSGGALDFSGMTGTLSALLNNTDTKILARPRILTMNNEIARIELSSKEVARQTSQTATSNNVTTTGITYEEKDTGVVLEVIPQISRDGYVTMKLKPSVSDLEQSRYTDQYDLHKRATETTVMVKDGETVVIGGLIKKKNTHGIKKVPFLGDIPMLGLAFRYKSVDDSDKELIIFITPHIVKENSYMLANISEREQEKPQFDEKKKEIKTVLDLIGREESK